MAISMLTTPLPPLGRLRAASTDVMQFAWLFGPRAEGRGLAMQLLLHKKTMMHASAMVSWAYKNVLSAKVAVINLIGRYTRMRY